MCVLMAFIKIVMGLNALAYALIDKMYILYRFSCFIVLH